MNAKTDKKPISKLTIRGFKSIRRLDNFPLNNLNVLIGANGVGKSNLVSYFSMLGNLLGSSLKVWTSKQGGADRDRQDGQQDAGAAKAGALRVCHWPCE